MRKMNTQTTIWNCTTVFWINNLKNTMNNKYISLLCAGVLSLLFLACKEDIGNIGLNVQPEDELLNTIFFDSTTLTAYSVLNDSMVTSNSTMSLLGDLHDPVFGKTQAAIYTQFHLSANNIVFNNNPYADSLILNLVYGGYYGDTTQTIRIRVYELSEDLKRDEVYYQYSTLTHKSELLAEVQIKPTPTTVRDTSTTAAYMSIPLSKDFAENKFLKADTLQLANDASFVNYFKGFYIEAEAVSSNGCMLSINLLSSRSSMNLYYGNDETSNLMEQFIIDTSCVRFSHINHFGYAEAEANLSAQLMGDYSSTKDVLYGQSAGGIKTVIQFPHLKEMFAGQQVIIHKAELVITHKDDNQSHFVAPVALSLSYDSETDKNLMLFDYTLGSAYFGGTYNEENKQYAFRITKYIQAIADGTGEGCKLNLLVIPTVTRLSRSQFYGTDADAEKRIKLKINYTIINK